MGPSEQTAYSRRTRSEPASGAASEMGDAV